MALAEEVEHLGVPVVGAERPAVVEDDRLSVLRAPVLVEDFNAIFGRDGSHGMVPRWRADDRETPGLACTSHRSAAVPRPLSSVDGGFGFAIALAIRSCSLGLRNHSVQERRRQSCRSKAASREPKSNAGTL